MSLGLSVLRSSWGIAAFVALWWLAAFLYGSFVLPTPERTWQALLALNEAGRVWPAVLASGVRVGAGFALAVLVGTALGVSCGLVPPLARGLRPLVTLFLGIPPIAWLVLALIWFGPAGGASVFTVVVTAFPIVFANAVEGVRTIDRGLEQMVDVFGISGFERLRVLHAPHVVSYLFPALVTSLGMAWKVTLMAEMLGAPNGIGAELGVARTNLATDEALAWIGLVVALLLAGEYLILHPVRRRIERWRTRAPASRPEEAA